MFAHYFSVQHSSLKDLDSGVFGLCNGLVSVLNTALTIPTPSLQRVLPHSPQVKLVMVLCVSVVLLYCFGVPDTSLKFASGIKKFVEKVDPLIFLQSMDNIHQR